MLYYEENENLNNIRILKELNSLVYTKKLEYKSKILELKNLIQSECHTLYIDLWRHLSISYIGHMELGSKDYIKEYLNEIQFKHSDFNLNFDEDLKIIRLKNKINNILSDDAIVLKSQLAIDSLEDFRIPIVDFSANDLLTKELVNTIKTG